MRSRQAVRSPNLNTEEWNPMARTLAGRLVGDYMRPLRLLHPDVRSKSVFTQCYPASFLGENLARDWDTKCGQRRFESAGKRSDGTQPYSASKALSSLSGPRKSPTSDPGPLEHPLDGDVPPESTVTLETSLPVSCTDSPSVSVSGSPSPPPSVAPTPTVSTKPVPNGLSAADSEGNMGDSRGWVSGVDYVPEVCCVDTGRPITA